VEVGIYATFIPFQAYTVIGLDLHAVVSLYHLQAGKQIDACGKNSRLREIF